RGAGPRRDPDPDPWRDDLLVAGIHRRPARILVVVGSAHPHDRVHLSRVVRHLGRHGPLRQPTPAARLMALETDLAASRPGAAAPTATATHAAAGAATDRSARAPVLQVEHLHVVYRTRAG